MLRFFIRTLSWMLAIIIYLANCLACMLRFISHISSISLLYFSSNRHTVYGNHFNNTSTWFESIIFVSLSIWTCMEHWTLSIKLCYCSSQNFFVEFVYVTHFSTPCDLLGFLVWHSVLVNYILFEFDAPWRNSKNLLHVK